MYQTVKWTKNVPEVESNSPELSEIVLIDNRRKPA